MFSKKKRGEVRPKILISRPELLSGAQKKCPIVSLFAIFRANKTISDRLIAIFSRNQLFLTG